MFTVILELFNIVTSSSSVSSTFPANLLKALPICSTGFKFPILIFPISAVLPATSSDFLARFSRPPIICLLIDAANPAAIAANAIGVLAKNPSSGPNTEFIP